MIVPTCDTKLKTSLSCTQHHAAPRARGRRRRRRRSGHRARRPRRRAHVRRPRRPLGGRVVPRAARLPRAPALRGAGLPVQAGLRRVAAAFEGAPLSGLHIVVAMLAALPRMRRGAMGTAARCACTRARSAVREPKCALKRWGRALKPMGTSRAAPQLAARAPATHRRRQSDACVPACLLPARPPAARRAPSASECRSRLAATASPRTAPSRATCTTATS